MLAFRSALHQMAGLPDDTDSPSESELLRRFRDNRDEVAFGVLLHRHGPMVFGVCRRMLTTWQDAEDAFQATFLVLALKPDGPRPPDRLGAWLYGVACRVALKARRTAARRVASEQAAVRPEAEHSAPSLDADLLTILDDAIRSLPEKYRLPVVECHLAGRSRKEAAARLGWSEGTLSGRLARALDLLAARLTRRGVGLPAAGLVGMLSAQPLSATVSSSLFASTFSIANLILAGLPMPAGLTQSLTKGALTAMRWNTQKVVAVAVAGALAIGAGLAGPILATSEPPVAPSAPLKKESPAAATRPGRVPVWVVKRSVTREHPVGVLAVSAEHVAIGDEGGNLWLWAPNAGTAPEIVFKGGQGEGLMKSINHLTFTADGTHLYAITDNGRGIWRNRLIPEKAGHGLSGDEGRYLGFSAGGETWIEWSGSKRFLLRANVWAEPDTPSMYKAIDPFDAAITRVVFSPDSKGLAALTADGAIRLIDRDGLKVAHTIPVKGLAARAVQFSPDGKQLAVVGESGFARVYDVVKGAEAYELKGNDGIVFAVTFSPDGAHIATGGQDHLIRIWGAKTGQPLATLKGHTDTVRDLVFAPDGKTLVSGSTDKTVKVWERTK